MLKPLTLIPLFVLIVTFTPVQAQDESASWPPDPAEIFAEGVEVVDVEFHTSTEAIVNNETRSVKVFDNENATWHDFNFSEEVSSIVRSAYQKRSDGTILFNQPELYSNIPEDWPEMWILNPQTGEFSQLVIICGKYPKALPYEGEWVFYVDPQVNRTTLCNTETGDLKGVFSRHLYWQSASENPTGEWLLLRATKEDAMWSQTLVQYFSYNLLTGDLLYLGEIESGEVDYIEDQWVHDTTVLIYSGYMPEGFGKSYYRLDLTEPNSATFLINGRAWYHDNPPRYEYLMTYWEVFHRADWGASCEINVYDIPTDISYSKTLASNCFGKVRRGGDDYFYVSLNSQDSNLLSLYQLNITTDETLEWSVENIVALQNVSPDGRYVTLMLNNGRYSPPWEREGFPTYEDLDPFNYGLYGLSFSEDEYRIYDTLNEQWVGELYTSAPIWIAECQFLTVDTLENNPSVGESLSLFRVSSQGLVQNWTIDDLDIYDLIVSPNQAYMMLEMSSGGSSVVNLQAVEITQTIYPLEGTGYRIAMVRWVDDNTLKYQIEKVILGDPNYVVYTIRVPQAES